MNQVQQLTKSMDETIAAIESLLSADESDEPEAVTEVEVKAEGEFNYGAVELPNGQRLEIVPSNE